MTQARLERARGWTGLLLALLCPFAWLLTAWHLAVEAHHDHHDDGGHALVDHDHDRDHHDEDHRHADDAPRPDGHHADDHRIVDSLRPAPDVPSIDLAPREQVLDAWDLFTTPTPAAPPCHDIAPATDPPPAARRPRAPPVG